MAKGKLVRVHVLYIVATAAVGGVYTSVLFIVVKVRVAPVFTINSVMNSP